MPNTYQIMKNPFLLQNYSCFNWLIAIMFENFVKYENMIYVMNKKEVSR